jgi:anaerobic magnesium-protoporphyrin IX monomethyl ester cyclase
MSRVVLYNPPSSALRKPVLPMSLLALGALLEGEQEYGIVDGNLDGDPVRSLARHVEDGADVLGLTVMPGCQLADAMAVSRTLDRRYPGLTIVWGGYFPTQHYDACLRAPYVDYVIRGHGEAVFRALVRALAAGADVASLPGLAYRDRSTGRTVANPLAPIPHPEELPDFPYHRVSLRRYLRSTFIGRRTVAHHSSYGCPFLCNFCAVVNLVNGRWLPQSAERAARVVKHLVERYGVDAVEMYDNNFFVHEARTLEFASRIQPLGIGWWGEGRIDTLLKYSDRTMARMRQSGLRMVFLGAESGSNQTLQRMNKGGTATTQKTLALAERMKRSDIVPEFSFVVGVPPDPEGDLRMTIQFIRKLKTINPESEIILYPYTPVPLAGTLYEEATESGFRFPQTLEQWVDPSWLEFSHRRSVKMPWLHQELGQRIGDFQRVLNAYYPTRTDVRLWGGWRWLLRGTAAWRYHLEYYARPYELKVVDKMVRYQRPETSGF